MCTFYLQLAGNSVRVVVLQGELLLRCQHDAISVYTPNIKEAELQNERVESFILNREGGNYIYTHTLYCFWWEGSA